MENENGFERFIKSNINSIRSEDFYVPLGNKLQGFEISRSMQLIGLINLLLNGIKEPAIELVDTLSVQFDEKYSDRKYDVIITNPPWGRKTEKQNISNRLTYAGADSGLVFIKRALLMLNAGGRAAIVVPDGILQNPSQQQRRRELLRTCKIEAVISLPSAAFLPFTTTKTSILIFTKPEHDNLDFQTEDIWFYELKSDGYSVDRDRRKLSDNPLPQAADLYRDRFEGTSGGRMNAFFVSMREILDNELDLGFYRYCVPEFEELHFPPPHEIIDTLIAFESDIQKDLEDLQQSLR